MNLQNLVITIILFITLFIIFKKFNILVDNTNYSDHKKIGKHNKSPIILGGVYLVAVLLIFFPNEYLLVKILSILILMLGLLSDRNLFSNPKIRLIFQIFIIFVLVYLEKLTINNLSVDFINDLLNLLTKKRKSVAVVIDEYGGTSGIITVEDIIEELVGEIEDEHDSPKHLEKKLGNNYFRLSARVEIDYLNQKFKLNIPVSEQYETLGGFIISLNEKIPENDDKIFYNNLMFKIINVSSSKIEIVELIIED